MKVSQVNITETLALKLGEVYRTTINGSLCFIKRAYKASQNGTLQCEWVAYIPLPSLVVYCEGGSGISHVSTWGQSSNNCSKNKAEWVSYAVNKRYLDNVLGDSTLIWSADDINNMHLKEMGHASSTSLRTYLYTPLLPGVIVGDEYKHVPTYATFDVRVSYGKERPSRIIMNSNDMWGFNMMRTAGAFDKTPSWRETPEGSPIKSKTLDVLMRGMTIDLEPTDLMTPSDSSYGSGLISEGIAERVMSPSYRGRRLVSDIAYESSVLRNTISLDAYNTVRKNGGMFGVRGYDVAGSFMEHLPRELAKKPKWRNRNIQGYTRILDWGD